MARKRSPYAAMSSPKYCEKLRAKRSAPAMPSSGRTRQTTNFADFARNSLRRYEPRNPVAPVNIRLGSKRTAFGDVDPAGREGAIASCPTVDQETIRQVTLLARDVSG